MSEAILIPSDANRGDKAWAARITGRDPKLTFKREFGVRYVTGCGLFEATEVGKKTTGRAYYAVLADDTEGLVRIRLREETLALLLDKVGPDNTADVVPYKDADGRWRVIREGGSIMRRSLLAGGVNREALEAEKAKLLARLAEINAALG